MKIGSAISFWTDSVLKSFSQVFFSQNRLFAVLLLIVAFFDPYAGLAGVISVVATNLFAYWIKYDKQLIRNGTYGFNSLLVGLGLGIYYEPNLPFFVLLIVASLLTLFITVNLAGWLYKYKLSFLSLPFLFGLWIALLATRQFEALGISSRGVYFLNELFNRGGSELVDFYTWLNNLPMPEVLSIYFKSLCAILFQYNLVAGIIIAIGLVIYSRIGFTLSLISFFSAYFFYQFVGADITQLSYTFIGFNFILSGIAVGGFFMIPSKWSYFWSVLLVPGLVLITAAFGSLLADFQLGLYSLPFNLVVISFIYAMKLRTRSSEPKEVPVQRFSPEKHLYDYQSNQQRFADFKAVAMGLPVYGRWIITQAHNGDITHKDAWRHAWDFEMVDDNGLKYKEDGSRPEHYYCFGKRVLSPAEGTVVAVETTIPDNEIGEVNLKNNWGNSVVIIHGEELYSQVSHLQKGSITVEPGDIVKKGQVIGKVGNSGRSPIPHLHFQLQKKMEIGAPTQKFPLAHYTVEQDGKKWFQFFGYPEKDEVVENIHAISMLEKAFRLVPGEKITFQTDEEQVTCEVKVNIFNESYLEDEHSGARLFFKRDRYLFYGTHFEGRKKGLLYWFFLATYHVPLGSLPHLSVEELIPLYQVRGMPWRWLYDFVAPFTHLLKAKYHFTSRITQESLEPEAMELESKVWLSNGFSREVAQFHFTIEKDKIQQFTIHRNGKTTEVTCDY